MARRMLGICIMAHSRLYRVGELAEHFAERGCAVSVHVDTCANDRDFATLKARLAPLSDRVILASRRRCPWGSFALATTAVDASQELAETFPEITHVSLVSGSCLPIRPVEDLQAHLAAHPDTDFVESKRFAEDDWIQDGLREERFTLYFPFNWAKQRRLFDAGVEVQRALRIKRRIPAHLDPSVGSQWWTLSRETLRRIAQDPMRGETDRFFRHAWIADESYVQTLVRNHARRWVDTSQTLTAFDPQGKPFVFYDDHAQLLEASDKFFARKVWHGAHGLYDRYLRGVVPLAVARRDQSEDLDTVIAAARKQRCDGRQGLVMQSRCPVPGFWRLPMTARDYLVLDGFEAVFPDIRRWQEASGMDRAHGHLFARDKVEFAGGKETAPGGLTNSVAIRDWNPEQFLRNLLWSAREDRQSFLFDEADAPDMLEPIAWDPNARVVAITGAWALNLHRKIGEPAAEVRARALALRAAEAEKIAILRGKYARARVTFRTLAEVLQDPERALDPIRAALGADLAGPVPVPAVARRLDQVLEDMRAVGLPAETIGPITAPELPKVVPLRSQSRR
ncbi:MAG: beta-1,6-N-acetylglucosaminyltransferase [Pseudomonadota bacterium]